MKNLFLIAAFILMIIVSCEKSQDSNYERYSNSQNSKIENYLNNTDENFEKKESGLYFSMIEAGTGKSPQKGDYVLYNYSLRLLDSTLLITTDSALAVQNNIYDTNLIYGPDKRQVGYMIEGYNEAFIYIKEGGSCNLVIPFELGYGEFHNDKIPPYSTLLADIELVKTINDPFLEEKTEFNEYVSQHEEFVKLTDGLYYKKLTEGDQTFVSKMSLIEFRYQMRLLDGRLVTTKEVKAYNGTISIQGLQSGMQNMTKFEKGIFIIRSDLAFFDNPNLTVPPYTTLMIEVEILDLL